MSKRLRAAQRTVLTAAAWMAMGGCAKTVCDVLRDEQAQNGCAPQGGAGGEAPATCQGDVEKRAKCLVDHTDDACRPTGSEKLDVDACVAE